MEKHVRNLVKARWLFPCAVNHGKTFAFTFISLIGSGIGQADGTSSNFLVIPLFERELPYRISGQTANLTTPPPDDTPSSLRSFERR